MPPAKKTTALHRSKAAPKPTPRRVVSAPVEEDDQDYPQECQTHTGNVTALLRNLSEIAYNNQAMLANIVTNQAILLRNIESQNANQARVTELIASTLKIMESDSRLHRGAVASMEATLKDNLGVSGDRVGEIGTQTGKVLDALLELTRTSKDNVEALQKMVARFG